VSNARPAVILSAKQGAKRKAQGVKLKLQTLNFEF